MCRACSDGGRRCTDQRVLRATNIDQLRPAADGAAPACQWGNTPSARELYQGYGTDVAGATIATLREVHETEPVMTCEFMAALPAGTRPHGLEHRVKSPQSLARKLADQARSERTLPAEELAADLTDVVRYTTVSPTGDDLLKDARKTIASLKRKGWHLEKVEHSFVDGNPYKGLHTLWRRRDGGPGVEVQFHTETSQRVKDSTHGDYEISRDSSKPLAQRRTAKRARQAASAQVPTPKGLASLRFLGGQPVNLKIYR